MSLFLCIFFFCFFFGSLFSCLFFPIDLSLFLFYLIFFIFPLFYMSACFLLVQSINKNMDLGKWRGWGTLGELG